MPNFLHLSKNPRLEEAIRNAFSQRTVNPTLLGPIDAATIKDQEVAAELFDVHTGSFKELLIGRSLIIGRRGAGKSALLRAYLQRPFLYDRILRERILTRRNTIFEAAKKYDLVV